MDHANYNQPYMDNNEYRSKANGGRDFISVKTQEDVLLEQGVGRSRVEKSLGLLTQRFLELLLSSPDQEIDINTAAEILFVKQKRRMYDITNVLEGISLIRKTSKSSVMWTGGDLVHGSSGDVKYQQRLTDLTEELDELEREEAVLDKHLQWISQSLRNVTESADNRPLAYTTYSDFHLCFPNDTLIAIQAPPGTFLEVPPTLNSNGKVMFSSATDSGNANEFKMHLSSTTGPIAASIINWQNKCVAPMDSAVLQISSTALADVCRQPIVPSCDVLSTHSNSSSGNAMCATAQSVQANSDVTATKSRSFQQTLNVQNNRVSNSTVPIIAASEISLASQSQESAFSVPSTASEDVTVLFEGTKSTTNSTAGGSHSDLLRLSPPPNTGDYLFCLSQNEGATDLFDVDFSGDFC